MFKIRNTSVFSQIFQIPGSIEWREDLYEGRYDLIVWPSYEEAEVIYAVLDQTIDGEHTPTNWIFV